jgi:hypothetical protein
MCELFAMSAGSHYTAQDYLPLFADKARANMSGWGIGFFHDGLVHIEKSCDGIYSGGQVHDSFQRLARVIEAVSLFPISDALRPVISRNPRLSLLPTISWTITGSSASQAKPREALPTIVDGP